MSVEVIMPQMGETVLEGTVNTWHKSAGQQVAEGEPLLEIGTDKVDTDIPAPASGTLAEIRVGEGETVPVSTVLAIIERGDPGHGGAGVSPGAAECPPGPARTNGSS